jgi:hypothetical protein
MEYCLIINIFVKIKAATCFYVVNKADANKRREAQKAN